VPGVPGAGLGGLFYVLAALMALLVELVATVRGRSSIARWRAVIRQSSLAAGIVVSITVTYSGLKLLVSDSPQPQPVASGTVVEATSQPTDAASLELLPIAPVVMTIGTLALVLALTLLVGLAARRRRARDTRAALPAIRPEDVPPALEPSPAVAA
jgi:hypothetical protein